MGKLKTKKTLVKRIKITGSGKIMRKKISRGHLKVKWSSSLRHKKGRSQEVSSTHTKSLRAMLPKS